MRSKKDLDESLYSRQLYVLGHEAMKKMGASNILVSGLGGVGAEIAKNLVLGGINSMTLHDEMLCISTDLSSQFFLKEQDVGKNRAKAVCTSLAELNPHVLVRVYLGPITQEVLAPFDVVILTETRLEEQLRISVLTRAKGVALIVAETRGVFSRVFCDFGPEFTVVDSDGEPAQTLMIAGITREKESVVACLDDTRHGLRNGDYVTFSEVQGMAELNGCKPIKIRVLGSDTFSIGDTTSFSPYLRGGLAHQVKMPTVVQFKSLTHALEEPQFVETDSSKSSEQRHLAFAAMHSYVKSKGDLPIHWCEEETTAFLHQVNVTNNHWRHSCRVDQELMRAFARTCSGNLGPMCAVVGGIAAQEAMKAVTGKFHPIVQWLYFDAVECVPSEPLSRTEVRRTGSRYDGQIAIFGQTFQKKLAALNYFVVGAGAIGCEMLKNLAMMGVGTSGSVTVTDMDLIEKSNLNRQFLFRARHIKKPKSVVAARAIKKMNPDVNVIPYELSVGQDSERVFTDSFYERLDGIATALDNVEARIYIDRQSVYYRKPLLESGTLGTKGNTQVIIPFLTESYSSSRDPPETSIPMCTLKSFPNAVEHTIQWARDLFDRLFFEDVYGAALYLSEETAFEMFLSRTGSQPVEVLEGVNKALGKERPVDFRSCVEWARSTWQELFYNQIRQLLVSFPPDQLTTSGQPFWSGPKRCPLPLVFSPSNKLHVDFIFAAANLRAQVYGMPRNDKRRVVQDMVGGMRGPPFVPRTLTVEEIENLALPERGGTDWKNVEEARKRLPPKDELMDLTICPLKFEKDDDTNFHMDFVLAASNLRATNYQIPLADRHKSKLVAGKIIPAIATTTSVVAGLSCLELLKLLRTPRQLASFKNNFLNLALPFMDSAEPLPPRKQTYYDVEWTLWDRFEVQGDITLLEFIDHFSDEHSFVVTMITYGLCVLFSAYGSPLVMKQRLSQTMTQIIKDVTKNEIEPNIKTFFFDMCCSNKEGKDIEVPYVRYTIA